MSRYVYECYFKREIISKDLYTWCLKEKWADADLIAKWKKVGFVSVFFPCFECLLSVFWGSYLLVGLYICYLVYCIGACWYLGMGAVS